MITLDQDQFQMYFLRMKNGDWQIQTIHNMLSQMKKRGEWEQYLAAKCAFEQYKLLDKG